MSELIGKCDTPVDLLNMAIKFENDSIIFYLGMKKLVPEDLGKDKVEKLIEEEMKHVVMLNKEIHILEK